jgi:hypothetical protein
MPLLIVLYKCLRWHVSGGPTLNIPPEWGWECYGGTHFGHSCFNFKVQFIGPPAHYEDMKQLLNEFYTNYANAEYIGHFIIRDSLRGVEQETNDSPHLV